MSGYHKVAVNMKAVAVSSPDIVDLTNKTSGEKKATERQHLDTFGYHGATSALRATGQYQAKWVFLNHG